MNVIVGRFVALTALCLMLQGCAQMGPPLPPSLELPKPPADLRATRKGNQVTLTWSEPTRTTDRQSVRYMGPTHICRTVESEMHVCGNPVGELAPPPVPSAALKSGEPKPQTYTDTLPSGVQSGNPAHFVTYAVEVLNRDGRGAGLSNQVRVPAVPTWPPFENFTAQITGDGVRVSWSLPPPPGRAPDFRCLFRVYRRLEGTTKGNRIADIDLSRCLGFVYLVPLAPNAPTQPATQPAEAEGKRSLADTFLDQTMEWEKTYFYHGTVVSVVADAEGHDVEVEGDDTPEVKVIAHDVFPPDVPAGLQAVFSGEGQKPFVDLIWAPVTNADLAGYNVYRSEAGGAAVKLNSELVKSPSYRDSEVASGKTYVYSVSAVDVRGNESLKSEEASETVP